MDYILLILGIICLIGGLIGCILPALPGPPLSYVGLLLIHFTRWIQFSITELLIALGIVVIVQIIDYFIPIYGTKRMGGTRWGTWGCFIGTIVGLLFFPPWGILIGPFAGAVVGELLGGKEAANALRAGFGALAGFLLGTILKLIVCAWFIFSIFTHIV